MLLVIQFNTSNSYSLYGSHLSTATFSDDRPKDICLRHPQNGGQEYLFTLHKGSYKNVFRTI